MLKTRSTATAVPSGRLKPYRSNPFLLGVLPLLVSSALFADASSAAPTAGAPVAVESPGTGESAANAGGYLSLGRSLFGPQFGASSGLKLGGWIEGGYAQNDNVHGSKGLGNSPVVFDRDTGFQLNAAHLLFEKEIKTNITPRVTPTPAPMPQDYSFGWYVDAMYGRDAQVYQTYGWDSRWSVNKPGNYNSTEAQEDRQCFLVVPQVFLQGYLPWYKGMAFMLGTWMSTGSYEIGFIPEPGPDFLYSHSYAMESSPIKQSGLLWAANLVKNKEFGILATEIGITQGWSNLSSNNGSPAFVFNLRYRTSDMSTWVDFCSMTGDSQANPAKVGFPQDAGDKWFADRVHIPTNVLISPRGQLKTEEDLVIIHEFSKKFKTVVEFTYGKQKGDGASDTIDVLTGPNFKGASWSGLNLEAQYKFTSTFSFAARAETFRDRDGYILFPNSSVKGDINEVTAGVQWHINPFFLVRPEVRYDAQSNNSGVGAFGFGTQTHQLGFATDLVCYF